MRGSTLRWFTLVLGLVLLAAPAHARKKKHVSLPTWDWGLALSEGVVYNDNLLGFSSQDQGVFETSPTTFPTPLESMDDYQSEFQIHPDVRWRAPMKLMVSADYRLKLVNRLQNRFSDYQTHSVGLTVRPRVAAYNWSARVRAFVIPSFYLRVYKDRDWGTWDPAKFRNWDYEAAFKYRFWQPLWFEARYAYGTYYYDPKFTEYDSDYREFTLGSSYDSPWDVNVSAGITRRFSDNIGKNQAGAVINSPSDPSLIGDSEYGDGSFKETEFNASVSSIVPWIKVRKTEAGINYRYRRRAYTSDQPLTLDPIHRGRLDKRWELGAVLGVNVVRSLDAEFRFSYEQRRADSPDLTVPRVKDFTRHEYGLALTYTIR